MWPAVVVSRSRFRLNRQSVHRSVRLFKAGAIQGLPAPRIGGLPFMLSGCKASTPERAWLLLRAPGDRRWPPRVPACHWRSQAPAVAARLAAVPLLQVAVSPGARIPQKAVKLKIWEKRVAQEGGNFLGKATAEQAGATHLLCGDEPPLPPPSPPPQMPPEASSTAGQQQCVAVHYSWLEGCLAKRCRLNEADFHPAALAEAAANGGYGDGATAGGTQQPGGSGAAHVATAAAAARGPPPLRQLAIRSPTLVAADVQQLLLHLLADAPRPHWLSIHVRSGSHAAWPSLCCCPSGCPAAES